MYADENMISLTNLIGSRNKQQGGCNETYAILEENTDIPEGGIEFDLPPELHKKVPKALLSSVRRFHFNSGHPPNNELERIVRLSGGSEFARAAVKGIRCTICRKAAAAKSPKPGKVRTNIGQFNDTLLIDLGCRQDICICRHGGRRHRLVCC